MDKGIIAVISGFSGVGKGTIVKHLLRTYPETYALSVSATTRERRQNEEEGREYFFKTRQEFDRMIKNGEFLEYATFNGNSYGTPKAYVDKMTDSGMDILLEIEVQGALQVKKLFPETALIFISAPSAEELKKRLTGRGTEDEETIKNRLAISVTESKVIDKYDYLVINDTVENACDRIHRIIQSEHFSVSRNGMLIETIQKDLQRFVQ